MPNSDKLERNKIINELDKNLLVSASAGSGKTASLVERMVALVESGNVQLSKMAALTFTKKAAGEFYDRFYKKLQLRTKPGFDKTKDDPYSLLDNPNRDAIERDKIALKTIDTCFFGTIDAFYQKILNEHPLEAGIPTNSEIVDDEEFNLLLIKRFNKYLKSDNKTLRENALFFNTNIGEKIFPEMMSNILKNKDLNLYQISGDIKSLENSIKYLLRDFKIGMKILDENCDTLRARKKDDSDSTIDSGKSWEFLFEHANALANIQNDDYKTIKNYLKNLSNLRFNCGLEFLFKNGNFLTNFAVLSKDEKYYTISDEFKRIIDTLIYIKTIDFLNASKNDIDEYLINEGKLTFDQATHCLLKLLRNEKEYKPTIEQIRRKIDCLLIDECQDTDIKQYEIFFRLTANDFNDDFRKLTIDGGKLYACGDRKQGIYHFRGADVSTFDEIKDLFEKSKVNGLPYDIVNLTDNFRSKGKLIQYFNKTFNRLLDAQGYDPILNDEIKDDINLYGAFKYFSNKDDDPERVADLILKVKNSGYSFKDFMVITSNKSNISNYAKEFSTRGIPCYSEGNVDINVSALINVVINFFKYIASNRQDMISYLEVLSSPLFKFDIKKTINLDKDYLLDIGININKLPELPSALLEQVASNTKILKALNLKGIDVLVGFIHLLKDMENNGDVSCYGDAIKYFQELQSGDKAIERLSLLANDIDAVQIANAHKTKGLEKKIVILTFAGTGKTSVDSVKTKDEYIIISESMTLSNGFNMNVLNNPTADTNPFMIDLVNKEKEYFENENLRLLYVAATRARDYLFICSPLNKQEKPASNKWSDLLDDSISDKASVLNANADNNLSSTDLKESNLIIDKEKLERKSFNNISPSKIDVHIRHDEDLMRSFLSREDSLIFGTMVHKLLECIIKAKNIKLDFSICKLISEEFGKPDLKDNLEEVRKTIYSGGYSQEDCPFSDIYKQSQNYECHTEVPFAFKEGDDIVNGNIDLIMESDKEIIIIDYKTDVNDYDHSAQLKCYEKALEKSHQFENKTIKSFIYNIKK